MSTVTLNFLENLELEIITPLYIVFSLTIKQFECFL